MCTYCRQTDSTDRAADAKGVLFDQYSCTAILAAIEKCTSYSQLIKLLLRCGFDLGIANSDSNPRRTGGRYPFPRTCTCIPPPSACIPPPSTCIAGQFAHVYARAFIPLPARARMYSVHFSLHISDLCLSEGDVMADVGVLCVEA